MRTETANKIENLTAAELRAARIRLGLNMAEMATQLRTPYRTYQEWENGGRRIPGICTIAVELLEKKDRWIMMAIEAKIAREYKP
jgi:DNA-binding transcriptional regulator YiaG